MIAHSENSTEIRQFQHREDGFECVVVDAHRRGYVSGGLHRRTHLVSGIVL